MQLNLRNDSEIKSEEDSLATLKNNVSFQINNDKLEIIVP